MEHKLPASRGEPLASQEIESLRREVDRAGVPATARRLRVAANVVPRALAGLPILRGSAALIREGLGSAVPESEFPPLGAGDLLYGETAEATP